MKNSRRFVTALLSVLAGGGGILTQSLKVNAMDPANLDRATYGMQYNMEKVNKLNDLCGNYLSRYYELGDYLGEPGLNGVSRIATEKSSGKKVILKYCASNSTDINYKVPGDNYVRYGLMPSHRYLGELEICKRFPTRERFSTKEEKLMYNLYGRYSTETLSGGKTWIKAYSGVDIGPGINKILNLYKVHNDTVLQSGDWDTVIALEFVEGDTLEKYVENKSYGDEQVLSWLIQVLDCLRPLHEKGWAHLDLNSSNVIVKKNGSLCLIDLGKALDLEDKDHDVIGPDYSVKYIKANDKSEMHVLMRNLGYFGGESKGYRSSNSGLKKEIEEAYGKSENCKELRNALLGLKEKYKK